MTLILEKIVYKELEHIKSAIPSCPRHLQRVIYKSWLNTWNTKYSENVTCVCKNVLSVKQILLECPTTVELFQKEGSASNVQARIVLVALCPMLSALLGGSLLF